jgi:GntR family transcriptional regulator
MPRPDENAILAVPPGVPVIELLHTGIDQDGKPFEVTRFVMRADRSGLDYNIPIEEPE